MPCHHPRICKRKEHHILYSFAYLLLAIISTILLCMSIAALFAGCSDLQARGPMATEIDAQAMMATSCLPAATQGTLDANSGKLALRGNAKTFVDYDAAKTTNLFAYWFDPNKQILVSPVYFELLGRTNALAQESNARADKLAVPMLNALAAQEYQALVNVKKAKDGVK